MKYNKEQIERIVSKLISTSERDLESDYIELLDCEGTVTVAGIEFLPSEILNNLDPTAYRCGLNDHIDSVLGDIYEEIDGEYYRIDDINDLLDE